MLTRSGSIAALASLRYWLIGGEAFPLALARQIRSALPARIINMYGPTESTVWSTCYEITGEDTGKEQTIPIGAPLTNTYLRIFDANGSITAPGEIGELFIGGPGVTRGYWKQPELTAERFLPDAAGATPGARLYRTGDLVRENEDGLIEFLGRADFQVKIRGYRIELGEIEAVLGNHPAVREVIVVTQLDASGEPQLVAYIIAREESGLSTAELRIYCRQKLPEYMRPASFAFLTALPMTPNCKVDRKALVHVLGAKNGGKTADMPAMSTLEKRIAAEWQELLGGIQIDLRSNFFDLGANSLTVAEAATRFRERLGLEVKLTDLFAYPTVAALAAYLGRVNPAPTGSAAVERGAARRAALAARTRRTS
jgi:acyl-coenzyme A synthetase/AMP-(fatty) acid ligase/aryl carrier-like protein